VYELTSEGELTKRREETEETEEAEVVFIIV
jgi:hypothetical protein